MEAQLKKGNQDFQISGAKSAAGGTEWKLRNHSTVKKSKGRAKRNKDKMKRQGCNRISEDDDGIGKIPDVHSAPICESKVIRSNVENPTDNLKTNTGMERSPPEKEKYVQLIPNVIEMEEMKVVEPAVKIDPNVGLGEDPNHQANAMDAPSFQEGYGAQVVGESKTTDVHIKTDSNPEILPKSFDPEKPESSPVSTDDGKITPPEPGKKEDRNCSATSVSKLAAEYGRIFLEKVAGAGRTIAWRVKRGIGGSDRCKVTE